MLTEFISITAVDPGNVRTCTDIGKEIGAELSLVACTSEFK